MASIYWSVVTCTTVGYGDILPKKGWELIWAMIIIVLGVFLFMFILGDLSSQFSELTRSSKANEDRIRQIHDLDSKFNIGLDLVDKLQLYFEQNEKSLETSAIYDMSYLMKILPANLKIQLAKLLHQDAIARVKFLQD